ncbi:hypothetical protein WOLCODRAFT_140487 [Wolfiporia cocos MD-104 SS10]|uniref:Uncharacterized protein n=1 Tax=Wolfiporia cocos (strain MD-104) TaxID=742152 RepID=A0A2H3JCN9_WOLCO|nr:hypothetical protein WOLCODRAFT_140487 [Wolfiporia cocos MD-104 SS10]
MATFYSSFFSSGLLAPLPHEQALSGPSSSSAADCPLTPRQARLTLTTDGTNADTPALGGAAPDPDTTPTASAFALPPPGSNYVGDVLPSAHGRAASASSVDDTFDQNTSAAPSASRKPSFRRRRSSVAGAASPVSAIKARPTPARQSLLVSRARSGSESRMATSATQTTESAVQGSNGVARSRSGSVAGTTHRTSSTRRAARKPAPPLPAPPPSAPLPAPPAITASAPSPPPQPAPSAPSAAPPATPHPMDRPPALSLPAMPFSSPGSHLSLPVPFLTPSEEELAFAWSNGSPSTSPCEPALARLSVQGDGATHLDYPSPVDGDRAFVWETQKKTQMEA